MASGSIVSSPNRCLVCARTPGFIYEGPVFAKEDLGDAVCPWCIHSGAAHDRFDAEFVDPAAVGSYGAWERVGEMIIDEICFRTPSFNGWQQERWYTHCADGAAFVGFFGWRELQQLGPEAVKFISDECGYETPLLEDYLQSLDPTHGPTAYLFRCLKCGKFGGYSDCH